MVVPPFAREGVEPMVRAVVIVMALVTLAAVPARAQEAKGLEPVVVTGTRIETPAEQVGASVTLIEGDEFATRHYPSVHDALRNVPGIDIRQSGSLGKTTGISIRGANPNQVQVLVDGVRVKSPTLGQVDLTELAPDMIERIEVIRGPQSTIYGADAIGGVVHIITRRGSGPPTGYASQEVGNHDTVRTRTGVNGASGPFDYALGFFHLGSKGQFVNDGVNQDAASGRFG